MTNSGLQTGPAPGQGLQEYCQQMRAMGMAGGQTNNSASGTCYQAYNECSTSCDGMANGYSGQAAQMMKDTANTCRGFQARVTVLANQGLNSQTSASSGDMCNNVSQAAPQSAPGGAPAAAAASDALNSAQPANAAGDPYGCAANPSSAACQNCSANPGSAACRALAYEKEIRGEANFSEQAAASTDKSKGSGFDIPDSAPGGFTGATTDPNFQPTAIKNGTIANNSGGSIPGGGGGSPASLNGGGRGGSPGSPGYTTDVLQGLSSPSGYSQSVDANVDTGGGGFAGYANGRTPATDQNGIDLRRFLPGGDKDPKRRGRAVGGLDLNAAQINGKFVNIWDRISERMQEKCRLRELIGCE